MFSDVPDGMVDIRLHRGHVIDPSMDPSGTILKDTERDISEIGEEVAAEYRTKVAESL